MLKRNNPSIAKEMEILRGSLKVLDRSLRRLAPLFKGAASSHDALKRSIHSRPRLSAKARVAMVLQGRYMGYMRQLKPRQKAQVRKIREAKGVRAAIVRAREITRG